MEKQSKTKTNNNKKQTLKTPDESRLSVQWEN